MKTIIFRLLVIINLLFVSIQISNAQVTQEWVKDFICSAFVIDKPTSIGIDGSENIYVTGNYIGPSYPNKILTLKYNSSGILLWSRIFQNPNNNDARVTQMVNDNLGNIYICGTIINSSTGTDFLLLKYNSFGTLVWSKTWTYSTNAFADVATSLNLDVIGNIFVTGMAHTTGGYGRTDIITLKYSASGALEWMKNYNPYPYYNIPNIKKITTDNLGNAYITGFVDDGSIITIKYNFSGVIEWIRKYKQNGYTTGNGNDIIVDGYRNVYIGGDCFNFTNRDDFLIIKYNSTGTLQWTNVYNGSGDSTDEIKTIRLDQYNNVYVTGSSIGRGTSNDIVTIKLNNLGIQQWIKRYNGPANKNDFVRDMYVDASGNSYITGSRFAALSGVDYITIKYNSTGTQQWSMVYNGPGNLLGEDGAVSIKVSNSENVYVTGYSYSTNATNSNNNYTTVKYSQTSIRKPSNDYIPETYGLSQNYPNPFNPETKIKFDIPDKTQNVKLSFFDALGKEIEVLVNEQMNPGSYEINWNASGYPSGVYFYTIKTDNYTDTKKMILVK